MSRNEKAYVVIGLFLLSLGARAEYSTSFTGEPATVSAYDPYTTKIQQNSGNYVQKANDGGLVGGVAQKARDQQGSAPTFDQATTDVTDRKDNSNDSKNRTQAANQAAMAAGTAMMSAGIPMAASPIIPVTVAGWTLIGMGITEFAQAAAMRDSRDDFTKGRDILKTGDDGVQASAQGDEKKMPDDLSKFISDRGVNPDDLINGMKNGSITDPVAYLGGKTADGLSDDQKAQVDQLVKNSMGDHEGVATSSLEYDPANDKKLATADGQTNAAGGFAGSVRGLASEVPQSKVGGELTAAGADNAGAAGMAAAGANAGGRGVAEKIEGPHTGVDEFLAQYGFRPGAPGTAEAKLALTQNLERIGIWVAPKGQNIFQKATRIYRSFERWQKDFKVASLSQ